MCRRRGHSRRDRRDTSELLGPTGFGTDCTPQMQTFLNQAMRYGRTVATSRAFEQCVDHAMRATTLTSGVFPTGPYRQCNGDPFHGEGLSIQRTRVLDVARSSNAVKMFCTGGSGNASSGGGPYNQRTEEDFAFSSWLADVVAAPRSGAWPFSQTAGTIWHEAMHEHGYGHGANFPSEQALARTNCGYSATDATFDFQVNTLPYLIGNCMSSILDDSATQCGNIDACPAGQVKLITSFGGTGCECVTDPGAGIVNRGSSSFVHVTTAANVSATTTTIDHPLLNNQPNALVHFTHSYATPGGGGGAYLGLGTFALYNTWSARWMLVNTSAAMPAGTAFNIRVGRGIVHRTTAANVSGHLTRIEHALGNDNPNALLTVTPTPNALGVTGFSNNHPIGVWFDAGPKRWTIFNQDFATMPVNTAYTIEVEMDVNRGLHYVHTVTSANRSGHMTRLTSPHLDGKANARILVTPNWSRGAIYNPNQYGVWFDGASWWIYNEANAWVGAAMPLGAAFDIEILRDEIQRWVVVPESTIGVDTGIDLQPGDFLHVHGAQTMNVDVFGGVWGPEGSGVTSGWVFPLPTAPDFSLIGSLPSGLFPIGRDGFRQAPTTTQRLLLRTNDWWTGNGSGFFEAAVRAFR